MKQQNQTIDDYYNNGIVEMIRSGNVISIENKLSKELDEEMSHTIASQYDTLKNKVDSRIIKLKDMIAAANPMQLMLFCNFMFIQSNLGIYSEIQLSQDRIVAGRLGEYVQSVLVSTPNNCKDEEDQTKLFLSILNEFDKVHEDNLQFNYAWALKKADEMHNKKLVNEAFESLNMYYVRGNRYPVFHSKYLKNLLVAHSMEFTKLFGITDEDLVKGFNKLEYSISQGKLDPFNNIMNHLDNNKMIMDFKSLLYDDKTNELADSFSAIGNNVEEVTGWPNKLVRGLSYSINEDKIYFDKNSQFCGWPIVDLPIQKRPFITIDNAIYCFDYYSFVDNFYRAIQHLVSRLDPDYDWNHNQQKASEEYTANVFSQLLPGCIVHKNSFYRINGSKKQKAENDLIIEFEDVVIIVEVKAGSFVYTSPLTDFEHHIESYKNLIEKAGKQCNRVYNYLKDNTTAIFYNEDNSEKYRIIRDNYTYCYKFSVTVDNINEVAARAEKMSFLDIGTDIVSISIDDLNVYSEYFDDPWTFLHFMKQRSEATHIMTLALNDELDHLGMYINENCYTYDMETLDTNAEYVYTGYREKLDEYFGYLYHNRKMNEKPLPDVPKEISQMIQMIGSSNVHNKVWLTSYILDFSYDFKVSFYNTIQSVLVRQHKLGRMTPLVFNGHEKSVHLCCFVHQPEITEMSENEINDYTNSLILWFDEDHRERIDLFYNTNYDLISISGSSYSKTNIQLDEYDRLTTMARKRAEKTIEQYLRKNKKIGRNELCPCGSGKKYKKCCSRLRIM